MSLCEKPLIALTMGDPAGVGPEVIVRAWDDNRVHECCRPVVFGHPEVLNEALHLVGTNAFVRQIDDLAELTKRVFPTDEIPCLKVVDDAVLDVPHGTVDPRSGQAAYDALTAAIDAALAGAIGGIVTAPLSKSALHAAGHHYPGHTELLAERCGIDDFAMMLYLPPSEVPECPAGLGVVHVTLHMALREVFEQLTPESVLAKCRLAQHVMQHGFGLAEPRIGVCALNPHGGEDGLFGDEETRLIAPAVKQARSEGISASGPFPTDTLMVRARAGEFDAVVAMYHDQGHIALKLLGMHRAVNITLGLPILRTSVAHGTAFDRAWQGTAEGSGMVAALATAAELAGRREAFCVEK
jgi:4-hydroxythreonine-4-phosphate dehydrogenase